MQQPIEQLHNRSQTNAIAYEEYKSKLEIFRQLNFAPILYLGLKPPIASVSIWDLSEQDTLPRV